MTSIELLSPARDLACGKAAVDHGADAVYIGAARFGARQAAGNSVEDIAALCQYAHPFGVKVYVTLNTILYDDELEDTERLAWELYRAGVDAFIVQDMAMMKLNMPPVPLHASTQMDNRTVEKVVWLRDQGFRQVVLARELSLSDIRAIHQAVPEVSIEAFVHGALCVSYSGQCYASQHCFGRSANRGECAQFCRLPYTLRDADGRIIVADKHLLSLKDMNRSNALEEMMDAGVRSFKIEGRLKDVAYVKNVTAYYRQCIDRILLRRKEYSRPSVGESTFTFTPDLAQSFSRGYTDYFLHKRTEDMASWDSPKSRGQEVGVVKEVRGGCIVVAGTAPFSNGDGLCYMDERGQMQGFRVNRAEGNHLYPSSMPAVRKGDTLWRSHNQAWERMMEGTTAERRIALSWTLGETDEGFLLTASRCDGVSHTARFAYEKQIARSSQEDSIKQVLGKLGDTIYRLEEVVIAFSQPWFIPRSLLAEWRRETLAGLEEENRTTEEQIMKTSAQKRSFVAKPAFAEGRDYLLNVSNRLARRFYEECGISDVQPALERLPRKDATLMFCRYCIRYQMGWCPTHQQGKSPYREPFTLESRDGRRFLLQFDCKNCQMKIKEN